MSEVGDEIVALDGIRGRADRPRHGRVAWVEMRQILRAEEPAVFATWFEGLSSEGGAGDRLVL
jgi:hypothetical protein